MVLNLNKNMSEELKAKLQADYVTEERLLATERAKEKLKAISDMEKHDAKIEEKKEKAKLKEENASITAQNRLREEYMATPLTEGERVELLGLTEMANTGKNPDRGNMLRLADLRIKSKIVIEEAF